MIYKINTSKKNTVLLALIVSIAVPNMVWSVQDDNPPDLQPAFVCAHEGEDFYIESGRTGSLHECRQIHFRMSESEELRHDKGSSADRCEVTHEPTS